MRISGATMEASGGAGLLGGFRAVAGARGGSRFAPWVTGMKGIEHENRENWRAYLQGWEGRQCVAGVEVRAVFPGGWRSRGGAGAQPGRRRFWELTMAGLGAGA